MRRSGGVKDENMERKRKRGGRREMGKYKASQEKFIYLRS